MNYLARCLLLAASAASAGCSATMTASELAGAVGESYISEEDEILATCRTLERGGAGQRAPADARGKAIEGQGRRIEPPARRGCSRRSGSSRSTTPR